MFLLTLLACGSTYDRFDALANCVSVTTDSQGTVITEEYDAFGWPVLEIVDTAAAEPVVTILEYERVAGDVRERRRINDPVVVLTTFDGRGYPEETISNLFGFVDIICDNTYGKNGIESSECNGVTTTYDPCGNPLEVSTPYYAEAMTNTYLNCQPQGTTVVGVDATGDYGRTVQYDAFGRYIGDTTRRGNQTFSTIKEWTCPEI